MNMFKVLGCSCLALAREVRSLCAVRGGRWEQFGRRSTLLHPSSILIHNTSSEGTVGDTRPHLGITLIPFKFVKKNNLLLAPGTIENFEIV